MRHRVVASGGTWLLASLVAAAAAAGAPAADPAPPRLRLPDGVRPLGQSVELRLAPEAEGFAGATELELELARPTRLVWLNADGLELRDASLEWNGRRLAARVVAGGQGFAGFAVGARVGPGRARLRVAFRGVISRTDTEGLFAQRDGGRWYLFSQFQPLAARRAFPCFDEPAHKIPWRLTLRVPAGLRALSNTPPASEREHPDGTRSVSFAPTPPLSSYLLALAVGPFDVRDAGTAGRNATPLRIVVPRGRADEAEYAAAVTPRLLELLEDYFGSPHPYAKLDLLALPVSGFAMEHPGLVTFSQETLLRAPAEAGAAFRREYVGTCAHELAHQWVGNLVTIPWWDEVWLSESLASWLGVKIAARLHPEWAIDAARVVTRSEAMRADSLASARSIRQPIATEHDIYGAFDGITYAKGEAILEAVESWLGETALREGVRRYVSRHAGGTATAADFAAALSEAAGLDVHSVLAGLLDQPGVPLLRVALDCSGPAPLLLLAQAAYRPAGSRTPERSWRLPVCVRLPRPEGPQRECLVLEGPAASVPLGAGAACPGWVLANDGEAGYYRTLYQDGLLDRLLASGSLTPAERVGVAGDVQALLASGDLGVAPALGLLPRLAADPDPQVAVAGLTLLRALWRLADDASRPALAARVRALYGARALALGWRAAGDDDEATRLLRPALLEAVGVLGEDRDLARQALDVARAWIAAPEQADPDTLDAALLLAARAGDAPLFDALIRVARSSPDPESRRQAFAGLGRFREPALAGRALDLLLDPEVDAREGFDMLWAAAAWPETRGAGFDFVVAHADALLARLPRDAGTDLPALAAGFCDPGRRREVEGFFAPRVQGLRGGPRLLEQTLERIDQCIAQRTLHAAGLALALGGAAGAVP